MDQVYTTSLYNPMQACMQWLVIFRFSLNLCIRKAKSSNQAVIGVGSGGGGGRGAGATRPPNFTHCLHNELYCSIVIL